jgi:CTP synthase (UTP-ammonia lyase)
MKHIVLLGDRDERLVTHRELVAATTQLSDRVRLEWVGTDTAEARNTTKADGLWVIPGSPYRDDSAVYTAIERARVSGQPFLGTCGGFQYAVIEFARNVAGIPTASHAETAPDALDRVVDRLSCSLVGQERTIRALPGTLLARLVGLEPFIGFHWCNYGLAATYADLLSDHGLLVSARADDAGVEAIEVGDHRFFLATLFQPQVGSLAGMPLSPVIDAFIEAVVRR